MLCIIQKKIVSLQSKEIPIRVNNHSTIEIMAPVGSYESLAAAIKAGVNEVVFDRNGYLYHGRVKALADAAREAGLKF